MITDNQTNFVFIADSLPKKYPDFAREFILKLGQENIPYGVLPNTKDVWAVDYMPIQVSESKFVRFTYKPDYLISSKIKALSISDVDSICHAIGIETVKSDIILDGGNVSRWNDKVLMTSKIFIENRQIPELELIEQLKNLLEINDLFFVPVEKGDWLGHADGMARFIASDTVLINDFSKEEQEDYIDFLSALHNSGLKWRIFPYEIYDNEDLDDAAGLYLNFLELENYLILPIFNKVTDDEAIEKAKEIFPEKQLITILSNEPAQDTGIINCLTWNIKR
ncbi:peptidylarginine deiminase-like enzyme [Belliella baltica DSM 15883]|uniref:Peptidylarginine deiminase-like enzyme n=1 Tax=Belliella baltica (strain DSM 15883 / CIP 108006 / LMG 21964 / BA134) TaxID=866536 RepID=I3Z1P1_BELBD|nr:agmatine deiminase family protein [Belliella baltica]AFL83159.1 peptidylarginine deiminase-like enzyme [Belliella baltica DSM 15883]